jgi:hypothetical protein
LNCTSAEAEIGAEDAAADWAVETACDGRLLCCSDAAGSVTAAGGVVAAVAAVAAVDVTAAGDPLAGEHSAAHTAGGTDTDTDIDADAAAVADADTDADVADGERTGPQRPAASSAAQPAATASAAATVSRTVRLLQPPRASASVSVAAPMAAPVAAPVLAAESDVDAVCLSTAIRSPSARPHGSYPRAFRFLLHLLYGLYSPHAVCPAVPDGCRVTPRPLQASRHCRDRWPIVPRSWAKAIAPARPGHNTGGGVPGETVAGGHEGAAPDGANHRPG